MWKGGGSSEPNGPNSRVRDVSRDQGLSKSQQEQLQRQLEKQGENLSYRQISEMAKDIKNGV